MAGEKMGFFDEDTHIKRTLGAREKNILYLIAEKKCQNCGTPLEFHEMQVGHKKAASKGGRATLKNCVCLCYGCNNLQGTVNWDTFRKIQGKTVKEGNTNIIKSKLENLSLSELKALAKKFNVKVKGTIEEIPFGEYRKAPSKKQYINKLSRIVPETEIDSIISQVKSLEDHNIDKMKSKLERLSLRELKFVAKKYNIRVMGRIEQDFLDEIRLPPSKKQYVNKLAKIVPEEEIDFVLREMPLVQISH